MSAPSAQRSAKRSDWEILGSIAVALVLLGSFAVLDIAKRTTTSSLRWSISVGLIALVIASSLNAIRVLRIPPGHKPHRGMQLLTAMCFLAGVSLHFALRFQTGPLGFIALVFLTFTVPWLGLRWLDGLSRATKIEVEGRRATLKGKLSWLSYPALCFALLAVWWMAAAPMEFDPTAWQEAKEHSLVRYRMIDDLLENHISKMPANEAYKLTSPADRRWLKRSLFSPGDCTWFYVCGTVDGPPDAFIQVD